MKKYLILFFVVFVFISSCKKDINTEPAVQATAIKPIAPEEVLNWLNNHPDVKPAPVLLSKARQQTVAGQQVIRIPVATGAALYFTREGGALAVYAYKWHDEDPGAEKYTGSIDAYSFQTGQLKRLVYAADKLTKVYLLATVNYHVFDPKTTTNNFIEPFKIIWCWLTGGDWIEYGSDTTNGKFKPFCHYDEPSSDSSDDSAPTFDSNSYTLVQVDASKSGLGNMWGPPPCPPGSGTTTGSIPHKQVNTFQDPIGTDPGPGGVDCNTLNDTNWSAYILVPIDPASMLNTEITTLTMSQLIWLQSNPDIANECVAYINQQGYSDYSKDQVAWGIDYLMNNPTVTMDVFKNQFLSPSEGTEDGYDDAYWSNTSLSIPHQSLPSWSSFKAAFPFNTDPRYNTPENFYKSIGGDVYATAYKGPGTNTCAARLSKALNYSGIIIPSISNTTFKGADGKYYFIRARDLNNWMRKTFGTNDGDPNTPFNANHYHYTGA